MSLANNNLDVSIVSGETQLRRLFMYEAIIGSGAATADELRNIVNENLEKLYWRLSIAGVFKGSEQLPNGTAGRSLLVADTATAAKTVLSLENANNTSDANKPVSTAQSTALATKASTDTYGFLHVHFGGNGVRNEKLNAYFSSNGKTVLLNDMNPVWSGQGVNIAGPRDPSPLIIGDTLYIAHTINDGQGKVLQIARSVGGRPFEFFQNVDVSTTPSLFKAWAPEFFVDSNGDVYLFYTRVTFSDKLSAFCIKATNTTTLAGWSAPIEINFTGGWVPNNIDMSVIKDGVLYHGFFGSGPNIFRCTASSPVGPYSAPQQITTLRTGMPANSNLEGPCVLKDGNTFRMYFDNYVGVAPNFTFPGMYYSESTDLINWSGGQKVTSDRPMEPETTMRHGNVLKIESPQVYNWLTSAKPPVVRSVVFNGANPTAGTVETNPGTWSLQAKGSNREGDFIEYPGPGRLIINRTGYYSGLWVAQGLELDGSELRGLGGGYIAIKSSTNNIPSTQTYYTADFIDGPNAATASFNNLYLEQGALIWFIVKQNIAGRIDSRVSITKVG